MNITRAVGFFVSQWQSFNLEDSRQTLPISRIFHKLSNLAWNWKRGSIDRVTPLQTIKPPKSNPAQSSDRCVNSRPIRTYVVAINKDTFLHHVWTLRGTRYSCRPSAFPSPRMVWESMAGHTSPTRMGHWEAPSGSATCWRISTKLKVTSLWCVNWEKDRNRSRRWIESDTNRVHVLQQYQVRNLM